MDVGEYIVSVPHVKQVKLSPSGGRLVISSDGVWDALSAETAFECCRGMPPDAAASQIVKDKMMDTRGTYSPEEMSDKEILEAVLGRHSVYFQGWGRSSGTTNNKAHGTTTESDQSSNQELVQRLNEANNRLDEVVNILCQNNLMPEP